MNTPAFAEIDPGTSASRDDPARPWLRPRPNVVNVDPRPTSGMGMAYFAERTNGDFATYLRSYLGARGTCPRPIPAAEILSVTPGPGTLHLYARVLADLRARVARMRYHLVHHRWTGIGRDARGTVAVVDVEVVLYRHGKAHGKAVRLRAEVLAGGDEVVYRELRVLGVVSQSDIAGGAVSPMPPPSTSTVSPAGASS